MKLKEIAHSRTGDKGNISVISVIAYDEKDYEYIKKNVTSTKLKEYFKDIVHGTITRYEIGYGRCIGWRSHKISCY